MNVRTKKKLAKLFWLIPIILVLIVVVGIATGGIESNPESLPNPGDEEQNVSDSYNISEVAKHSTVDDCWLAIRGNVYDVTSFIPSHPGGQLILEGCGKDATELFESRPGSGTPHSSIASTTLVNFQIGTLDEQ